jgi:poly(3-hydroxybutyrate) depolymerase
MINRLRIVSVLLLVVSTGLAADLDTALDHAGANRAQIQTALDAVPADQRAGMEWLVTHMPQQDLQTLDATFLLENCDHAYAAWRNAPWHEEVSERLFFETILPYASINERRDNWRADFRDRFAPLVEGAQTPGQAAAMLNNGVFKQVGVIYSTKRPKADQSPYESMDAGMASCTGLTVLLVDACRSQGVPARFVGAPLWTDGSGNHSWAEVWDDGWHFTGAAEPSGMELDKAWFTGRAASASRTDPLNAIYAATWADTPIHFPMSWRLHDTTVGGIDVTDRYTVNRQPVPDGMARVRFKAVGSDGERVMVPLRITGDGFEPIDDMTRDERFDGNDHVMAMLPLGRTVTASFADGAGSIDFEVVKDEQLVSMSLPEVGSDDDTPLSAGEAEAAMVELWSKHADDIRATRSDEHEARVLTSGELTMPFWYTIYGEKPAGGRSLYISMHGGGGAPAEVNDQQWENQKKLYTPDEGVYLAPRAPTNTWNLWHQGHIDDFYDRLIENLIVFEDVNPDRVYLMGYSAGGDGVYQLAPRYADRLGAAAMMAGHPNETKPDGLRNLPFTLHMGGEDSAYSRNRIGREWKTALAELHAADSDGYPHHVEIHEGKGHWMDRQDAVAVPWMAEHARNLRPDRIVWLQDDVTHPRFYWLAVDEPVARRRMVVERDGQTIRIIEAGGAESLRIRLDDLMLDLEQDVIVEHGGQELFRGRVPRTRAMVQTTLSERGDLRGMFPAEVIVSIPASTEE